MSRPTVSIVITTYNRHAQLVRTLDSIEAQKFPDLEVIVVDDGTEHDTTILCDKHIWINRPPSPNFRNPAYPNNVGIRAATGDIVILQNAECRHEDPQTIAKLTSLVTSTNAVFAHVIALDQAGNPIQDYCPPSQPRPYFFCGAIRRDILLRLRGFDEDYIGAGYDDDDMAARLAGEGVEFLYTDVKVSHQWHQSAGVYADADQMRQLYEDKCAAMIRGELGTVRNLGRDWGGRP